MIRLRAVVCKLKEDEDENDERRLIGVSVMQGLGLGDVFVA